MKTSQSDLEQFIIFLLFSPFVPKWLDRIRGLLSDLSGNGTYKGSLSPAQTILCRKLGCRLLEQIFSMTLSGDHVCFKAYFQVKWEITNTLMPSSQMLVKLTDG